MAGVEADFEEILPRQNPRSWEPIEARRSQGTVGIGEVRRRFGLKGKFKRQGGGGVGRTGS